MKDIIVIGVDIAKNVFQIHGSDTQGKRVFHKRISRDRFLKTMAELPRSLVGVLSQ